MERNEEAAAISGEVAAAIEQSLRLGVTVPVVPQVTSVDVACLAVQQVWDGEFDISVFDADQPLYYFADVWGWRRGCSHNDWSLLFVVQR